MTTVPVTEANASDDFDYQEEKIAPARTTQDAVRMLKTREILVTKQSAGYELYSRVARIMFLVSFLCVLAVIGGTIWFAFELVSSAHVLHELQNTAVATAATR